MFVPLNVQRQWAFLLLLLVSMHWHRRSLCEPLCSHVSAHSFVFVSYFSCTLFMVDALCCGNLNSKRYKIWPNRATDIFVSCVSTLIRHLLLFTFNAEKRTRTMSTICIPSDLEIYHGRALCVCACLVVSVPSSFLFIAVWPFVLLMLSHISVCNIIYVGLLALLRLHLHLHLIHFRHRHRHCHRLCLCLCHSCDIVLCSESTWACLKLHKHKLIQAPNIAWFGVLNVLLFFLRDRSKWKQGNRKIKAPHMNRHDEIYSIVVVQSNFHRKFAMRERTSQGNNTIHHWI